MPLDLAAEYVGLSGSTIQAERKAGRFPQPVKLTPGRIVWYREDLDAWLDQKGGRRDGSGENPDDLDSIDELDRLIRGTRAA